MKRLLAMLSAAVTAIGLQAADPYPSGTDFNGDTWPSEAEAKLWTTNEFMRSDVAATYAYEDFKGGTEKDTFRPLQHSDQALASNLKIETGSLTRSIYRAIAVEGDSNTPVKQTIGEDGVVVDTLVKFTAYDDDANLAATDADAKFAVWVKETTADDTDDGNSTLQLMVTAGKYDRDAEKLVPTIYACDLSSDLENDFSLTNWFRLTVKAIPDLTKEGKIPGFVVCINGLVVTSEDVKKDIEASGLTLSPSATSWTGSGAIFPSLVSENQTIQQVGFAGTGWIDDLSITDTIPNFIADTACFYVTGGDKVASFVYNGQTWKAGDGPIQCPVSDAMPQIATNIKCVDGYFLASDTQAVTISAGETTTIGADAQAIVATVTIDGTAQPYGTLADAVAAINEAKASATLKLSADSTSGITISNGDDDGAYTITIDLAGKTITQGEEDIAAIYAESSSKIVIQDSVGTGVLQGSETSENGNIAFAATTATLLGGTYNGQVSAEPLALTEESTGVKILASANEEISATLPEGKELKANDDGYLVLVDKSTARYTVTFKEPDPADPEAEYTTTIVQTLNEDGTVTPPDTPTAEGWTFLGWFLTDEEGNLADTAFDFTTVITEDITLTAKWSNWTSLLGDPDAEGVYSIDDETDLIALQNNARTLSTKGVSFKLTDNIALTAAWKGIGLDKASDEGADYAFEGTFDGNGKTISNVVFANLNTKNATGAANNYRGFFGYVVGGTVKNLTVSGTGFGDGDLSALTSVGEGEYGCAMIVGELGSGATLEGCTAKGTISSATHNAAGVCIRLTGGTIKNCTNEVNVTGGYTKSAGIVAISQGGGTIEGCVNTGNITADGNADKAGLDGVAGIIAYAANNSVIVRDCTNSGTITVGTAAVATPIIGQIIGHQVCACTVAGTNTGLADAVSVGKSDVGAIDGLTFATANEDNTTVTFVANSAVTVSSATTYKVMASGAAFTLAKEGETITFDNSLATVTVSMDSALSADEYEITETKAAASEKVITYTLAKKQTVTPVTPGEPTDPYDTEKDAQAIAEAINASKATLINVPTGVTEDQKSAYLDIVAAKVASSTTEAGKYVVVVDFTSTIEETIKSEVKAETEALDLSAIAAATTGTSVSQTLESTRPGVYYSVIAGATLEGMGVRSSTMATDTTLSVTLPHYDGAGFYRIEASVSAQPVVTE